MHGDLNSNPQHSIKSWDDDVCLIPIAVGEGNVHDRQTGPRRLMDSQPSGNGELRVQGETLSHKVRQKENEEDSDVDPSPLHKRIHKYLQMTRTHEQVY